MGFTIKINAATQERKFKTPVSRQTNETCMYGSQSKYRGASYFSASQRPNFLGYLHVLCINLILFLYFFICLNFSDSFMLVTRQLQKITVVTVVPQMMEVLHWILGGVLVNPAFGLPPVYPPRMDTFRKSHIRVKFLLLKGKCKWENMFSCHM